MTPNTDVPVSVVGASVRSVLVGALAALAPGSVPSRLETQDPGSASEELRALYEAD
jgi:hypothetical protein